jgi:hypothetical protein
LRGVRAHLSYRIRFLNILWQKREVRGGWEGSWEEALTLAGRPLGPGSYAHCFSLALLLKVAIFAVFPCFSIFQKIL